MNFVFIKVVNVVAITLGEGRGFKEASGADRAKN